MVAFPVSSTRPESPGDLVLRAAVAAYLGRYRGLTRQHSESDLRVCVIDGHRMPRMHPHMLRHTFVTTMLDAGVSLHDVQIAARPADPRTTMRYDRACNNLGRHPHHILAAYMASGT
ncbi:site-specific integrase [Dactylosporangium sp. NPDC051541]|uniref:site-specific integrase n=1 Tax=Dactylosporangium sp. NPDC051541 TaxID=3363977 RepID=UPI0037BC38A6